MKVQASVKNIRLSFDSDLTKKELQIDFDRIQQVLINLIGNAIKFSQRKTEVSISVYSVDEETITIEVKDQGIGISEEDALKLFTPFFKSNSKLSKERNPRGNGLGLSICYNIAKSFQGDLTCVSELGCGSVFKFSFKA